MEMIDAAARGPFDGTLVRAGWRFSDGRKVFVDGSGGVSMFPLSRKISAEKLAILSGLLEAIMRRESKNKHILESVSPYPND
jgi:hypothetical protein